MGWTIPVSWRHLGLSQPNQDHGERQLLAIDSWCPETKLTLHLVRRFLIKYSSRDEVELLSRGTGGIVEVRGAIEGYEEESPLYGFLRYRRRNVIIKYLPEDCSRLIQGMHPQAFG